MPRFLCPSDALIEGGRGLRFVVAIDGNPFPAFAIRYGSAVYAYLNQCAHQSVEMDWNEGYFFDRAQHFLVCALHGAHYYPKTGRCAGGPCAGKGLIPLRVEEIDGEIRLLAE